MSNNPLKMIGLNIGSFGGNLGGVFNSRQRYNPAEAGKAMRSIGARAAAMKAANQAGDLNASNIQSMGYSKYGDIAAKGFENYQGEGNLSFNKQTGRTTSWDPNRYGEGRGGRTYVLGEGESLGKAGSDSERSRRRGMIDLNPQEEQNPYAEINRVLGTGIVGAQGGAINQASGIVPEPSSSLVNPFGLGAQGAIGGVFGSLFDRQNSMGSALQKRACKYKNKK